MTDGVGAGAETPGRAAWREAVLLTLLAAAAALGPTVAVRWARPALLNFGPNDADYVTGFRVDWEREGLTRFHWTTPSAKVNLPLAVRGDDLKLYMRIRRHFVEPAHVRLAVEGRSVATFDLASDAYRVIGIPLPRMSGERPFELSIDAPSSNPRPFGVALDWIEIARDGPGAEFVLGASLRLALLAAVLVAYLAPRLAGASRGLAAAHAAALVTAVSLGVAWDVVAAERIARLGLAAYAGVAAVAVVLARWPRARSVFAVSSSGVGGGLVALVLVALAVRLTLLLHPQFYYPDVRVHALFALQLAKDGLTTFLREFTVNQYRHSLGLQLVNGHWYAFPYPPAFYILCWPLLRLLHYRPEAAVEIVAAATNSLEAFIVFAFARRLKGSTAVGLAAAACVPLLPIFLARLSLAYFPALVGHAVDVLVLLYLLRHLSELDRPRVVLTLAGLVAVALLTYTQSVLNLGILLPLFLVLQITLDRGAAALRRHLGLALAGGLGVVVALAIFYGRYVPIFLDMRQGVPMAEERVLTEKAERSAPEPESHEDADDPYAGPDLNLARGMAKAAWRLWIFYGAFAPLLVAGVVLIARGTDAAEARFVAAWGATYVLLNLASGGLPGPNLVRYNKDLEIVAPLCCAGLGVVAVWLWQRGRLGALAAITYGASFVTFGAIRAARYLTERFVLER